jgi:hypothetical protein
MDPVQRRPRALDGHPWSLVAVAYVSMTLTGASPQTGRLAPALATQMALDPVASLAIGTLACGEHDAGTGARAVPEGVPA